MKVTTEECFLQGTVYIRGTFFQNIFLVCVTLFPSKISSEIFHTNIAVANQKHSLNSQNSLKSNITTSLILSANNNNNNNNNNKRINILNDN